jgi:hypothetical protein
MPPSAAPARAARAACTHRAAARAASAPAAAPPPPLRRCGAPAALRLAPARCRARPARAAAAAADAAAGTPSSSKAAGKGRMTYKPNSYNEIVADAVRALQAAIADGERLVEIEFPPLPSSKDGARRACVSQRAALRARRPCLRLWLRAHPPATTPPGALMRPLPRAQPTRAPPRSSSRLTSRWRSPPPSWRAPAPRVRPRAHAPPR